MVGVEQEWNNGGWRTEANCRGMDSEIFFVDRGTSNKEALAVCRECSVQLECLDYTLQAEHPVINYGVWAGKGPKEIRRLRSERLRQQREVYV